MRLVKIKDIGTVVSGSTPKTNVPEYWGGEIAWVTPKDLSLLDGQYLYDTAKKITQLGYDSCSTSLLPKDSVLFSSRAPIGLVAINKIPVCTNQGFKSIIPNKEVSSLYLYYALKYFSKTLERLGNGATFKELSKKTFEEFALPLPDISDQIRIADILSKAELLIRQRKESLRLLDEFLKSMFLEMFGDPVRNEKGWDQKPLDQIISDIKSGWSPVCEEFPRDDESQLAILKLSSVTNGEFNPDENKKLKESTVVKKRVEPKRKDVLFSRKNTRDLVGATAYLFKDYPNLLLPDTIFKIEYKPERINGIFLWRLLSNNHIRAQLTKLATGSAGSMPNISKKKLMALQIIVPPLKLQNHFARIVEQSQEVKEHYRASQQSLENLYQSLSQRVFSDPSILGKRTQHDQNVLRDEKTVV